MIKLNKSSLLPIVTKAYYFADTAKTAQVPYSLIKVSGEFGRVSVTCLNYNVISVFSIESDTFDEDFSFAVNASRFFDVIKNWSVSEEINFQVSESKVTLKSKNKKVTIACAVDEGYWPLKGPASIPSFAYESADIRKIVDSVVFCTSKTAYDVTHRGILIQSCDDSQILFAAQEGFRLASVLTKNNTLSGSFRCLADADMVKSAIRALDPSESVWVGISESRIDIFNSSGWVGIATIPAKYPDILRVRSMQFPYSFKLSASDLSSIAKSVLSVIRNTDHPRNARFSVVEAGIMLSAATDDGDIEDIMPVVVVDGSPFDDVKGCDVLYLSEPSQFFNSLILHTGPDKKHGFIFTTEELPGWTYNLLATR